MPQVLVIGYGNPLRGDDGLGWMVAAELFRQSLSTALQVLPCHQLTPELASTIQEADTVIFVDAARDGTPGDVRCVELEPGVVQPALAHEFTPSALLALTCELFGVCPPAYLLTVCGEDFGPGDALSEAVQRGIPELKIRLHQMIKQRRACPTH